MPLEFVLKHGPEWLKVDSEGWVHCEVPPSGQPLDVSIPLTVCLVSFGGVETEMQVRIDTRRSETGGNMWPLLTSRVAQRVRLLDSVLLRQRFEELLAPIFSFEEGRHLLVVAGRWARAMS